jgi:type IV pilus assembly protein PilB
MDRPSDIIIDGVRKPRLGEMLVGAGIITQDQLNTALEYQKTLGVNLGSILVKLGYVKDDVLVDFIAQQEGLPVAELENRVLPENLIRRVPKKLLLEHHVIPIAYKNGVLTLATSDPTDLLTVEAIQLATEYKIELALASSRAIQRALEQFFSEAEEAEKSRKAALVKELEEHHPAPAHLEDAAARHQVTPLQIRRALIPLLIEKGIITEEELIRKARTM